MHRLRLLAADSRYASPEELAEADIKPEQIPLDWRLMAHQVATVRALRKGDASIIINTAMTGDGKTLAGRLPLLNDKWRTFAMYPTNELVADQENSFRQLSQNWNPPSWGGKKVFQQAIDADVLDRELANFTELSRPEALEILLKDYDYILTNPDIFHLVMSFGYKQYATARSTLPGILSHRFPLFVFDEFHLFGAAQTASVMIAMMLLLETAKQGQPPRFLFLSATPQRLLTEMANRIGVKVEMVGGEDYEHGLSNPPQDYRRILQEVELSLYAGKLEAWVEEHVEDVILAFFKTHKSAATGLIIANGVATAHRVYDFLAPICRGCGIRLGLNTGDTPKSERSRNTTDYDLIVATSTVDVGVDFRINFLIFESLDAASHLQRLGRLGRHETAANGVPFEGYEAHALVPQWVVEAMQNQFPQGEARRNIYWETLHDALPPLQQFEPYIHHWAGVQAGKVLRELAQFDIHKQYEATFSALSTSFQQLFGKSVKKYIALNKNGQIETLEAAGSFRGGSPFSALLLNVGKAHKEIVRYNLITLLSYGDMEAISMDEMLKIAERGGQSIHPLQRSHPLAAYKLHRWLEQPRRLEIILDVPLETDWDFVIERRGFRFSPMGIPEQHTLNDELETRTLVALCVRDKTPDTLRRILRLGHFELIPFRDGAGITGTAAFGRDALLLDAVLYRKRQSNGAIIW